MFLSQVHKYGPTIISYRYKLTTDTDLIKEISNNLNAVDERLRERIYKHYWGYLMGVSLRYVSDRDLAKEIINDSFMKIFKHMGTFVCEDDENFNRMFKAWMAKITVHTALNEIRKNKAGSYHEELLDEHASLFFEAKHESRLHVKDIIALLDKLKPIYKKVFILYEIEGFNHEEIGEMMTIPASSSRVYLMRAKKKLRGLYRNLMID